MLGENIGNIKENTYPIGPLILIYLSQCIENCLMGGKQSEGYHLSEEQIETARRQAALRIG